MDGVMADLYRVSRVVGISVECLALVARNQQTDSVPKFFDHKLSITYTCRDIPMKIERGCKVRSERGNGRIKGSDCDIHMHIMF
jgi:hypothetical protein